MQPSNEISNFETQIQAKAAGIKPITEVKEEIFIKYEGEYGQGGRPLKRKPLNPYLEIDLIDPSDPILFEGEVQKYKPGFKSCFIDRWV